MSCSTDVELFNRRNTSTFFKILFSNCTFMVGWMLFRWSSQMNWCLIEYRNRFYSNHFYLAYRTKMPFKASVISFRSKSPTQSYNIQKVLFPRPLNIIIISLISWIAVIGSRNYFKLKNACLVFNYKNILNFTFQL